MYKKESCGELLAMRRGEDEPDLEDRRFSLGPSPPRGCVRANQRRIRRWEVLYAVLDASLRCAVPSQSGSLLFCEGFFTAWVNLKQFVVAVGRLVLGASLRCAALRGKVVG